MPLKTWRVGTLVYNRRSLISLFAWLLWGDFCFNLMEAVIPAIVPILLKNHGATNAMIGLLTGSVNTLIHMMVGPVVGYKSDRHRGPRGRRIPFIFWITPFIVVFLCLFPFCPKIARGLETYAAWNWMMQFSPVGSVILVMAAVFVLFQVSNTVLQQIFGCMYNDLVPQEMLSRFIGLFKMVGMLSVFLFNRYIFGKVETHTAHIFISAALFYAVAFYLICWKVKEGEYPPVDEKSRNAGMLGSIRIYFTECYSKSFYLVLFSALGIVALSSQAGTYRSFYYHDNLNMNWDEVGKLIGWIYVGMMALSYPAGMLADRIKPIRAMMVGELLTSVTFFLCFLFIADKHNALFWLMLTAVPLAISGVAIMPLQATLLPRDKFAQFLSAGGLVSSLFIIFGGWAAGKFMDWTGDYKYVFVWPAAWRILNVAALGYVWRVWKRHGGPHHYSPP